MSENIMRRLEDNEVFKAAQTVMLFHSLPDEPCTHGLVARAAASKRVVLPVVVDGENLELREYRGDGDLRRGAFNILEPCGPAFTDFAAIDMAAIPGVAFDPPGNRLGRGKGYYDRLLERLRPWRIPTMGVCFDFQKVDNVPAMPHDIRVNSVL